MFLALTAAAANSSAVFAPANQAFAYIRTPSRTLPPSISYTGTPAALALMSHMAMFTAETALWSTGPTRQ